MVRHAPNSIQFVSGRSDGSSRTLEYLKWRLWTARGERPCVMKRGLWSARCTQTLTSMSSPAEKSTIKQ